MSEPLTIDVCPDCGRQRGYFEAPLCQHLDPERYVDMVPVRMVREEDCEAVVRDRDEWERKARDRNRLTHQAIQERDEARAELAKLWEDVRPLWEAINALLRTPDWLRRNVLDAFPAPEEWKTSTTNEEQGS